MASYRKDRINEEVARILSDLLRTVKDYRITRNFVSITHVSVAPDLSTARVFFSAIGKDCDPKEIRKGLISASGYLRSRLAETLNLRRTPRLEFVYDDSMVNGARINVLLKKVEVELAEAEERDRLLEKQEAERAIDSDEADDENNIPEGGFSDD